MRKVFILVMFLLSLTNCYSQIGKEINSFDLKSTKNEIFSLNSNKDTKAYIVVFTSNNCPFAKLYPQRLIDLENKYKKENIHVIAIRSTDTTILLNDQFSNMQTYAENEHFNFPYLADNTQQVAKIFGAEKTPHAFIIWKEDDKWIIKYSGAIDDNGAEPNNVKHPYLINALEALIHGKEVKVKTTKSVGCAIHYYTDNTN